MPRAVLLILVLAGRAMAAGPDEVGYQGVLQDEDGTPISGTVDLRVQIWNDPTSVDDSDRLYVEDHLSVEVIQGVFSIRLGAGSAVLGTFDAGLFSEENRWLETLVDGEPLAPRTKFLSVPYALQARQAEALSGMSGAVMHFALPKCPPGWSDFAAAHGRTLVGVGTFGALQGASGTPLADLEVRQHTHAASTAAAATSSVVSHGHSVPSRATTSDTHSHRWVRWDGSLKDWISFNSGGGELTVTNWNNGMDQAGSGTYPVAASSSGTTTIYTDRDSHGHTVSSSSTGSGGAHNHTVAGSSVTTSTAGSSPTLPYLQLRVCIKD